ncbi:pyridoxal phosphate-dependent transferase [Rhexocercosporidium sp. MPI-PUGE-AT-0058]|nr:pyridoxal phosphate-dependent transferase [Rhexocercosporidium sp. MPI-PUGE-AT-0058]
MPSPINLQLGWPSPRLFPAEQLAVASTATLLNPEIVKDALIYGPDLGYTALRESIAKWLSAFYFPSTGAIPKERIAITGGASQNLASILQVFSDPHATKRVWMVEPTYFLPCTIFQDAGFADRLSGVPENEHGVDIEFLRNELSGFEAEEKKGAASLKMKPSSQYSKVFSHLLYLTPTFSNPSAKTMSTSVREELLVLAREFGILIIADEVYYFLRWPAEEPTSTSVELALIPPRIVDLDRASSPAESWGNSISNGSFSKIVAPGVRVGWAEASAKMTLRLSENGATRSGGAPSHLTSTFLHHLLSTGAMQKHIDEVLIPVHQSRYKVSMNAINMHLEPLGVRITTGAPYVVPEKDNVLVPAGGFSPLDEYALKFAYGEMFVVNGDETSAERSKNGFGNGARLCWAWHEESEIQDGIERLARLLKIMLAESGKWTT